jgi:hypothetical protein
MLLPKLKAKGSKLELTIGEVVPPVGPVIGVGRPSVLLLLLLDPPPDFLHETLNSDVMRKIAIIFFMFLPWC